MAYFERTYEGLRESLKQALSPGHFPIFTRAKNPNHLEGTRTGLTLKSLASFGAVDVSLWRPEDVPHGPDGYALKRPTKRDVAVAIKALRRCLEELKEEWSSFRARGCHFVVCGNAQLQTLLHVPEIASDLKDSYVFYPCKWIMRPKNAYPVVARAIEAAGKFMDLEEFITVVELAASASALDYYANETEEHRTARIQSRVDYYANETEEHRTARIQSQFIFAANESGEHRKARVDVLKATIARETAEKRALRVKNLDAKLKSFEKQAEIKAKYRFTISQRCWGTIMKLREQRFLKRSLESPTEQFDRQVRAAKHLENWKASWCNKTTEQRALEKTNRQVAWNERRSRMRVKKANALAMNLDIMTAITRGYHYKSLAGYKGKGDIRADPFGARLMSFYDTNPSKLEEDQKALRADAAAKLKALNYAAQRANDEKKRIAKWGPDHAKMTRGEKLKMAYEATRKKKEDAGAASEQEVVDGSAVDYPKEKWHTQKLYRQRKPKEAADLAAGLPVEPFMMDPNLAARGRKRTAKDAGLVEEVSRQVAAKKTSSSSGYAARPVTE